MPKHKASQIYLDSSQNPYLLYKNFRIYFSQIPKFKKWSVDLYWELAAKNEIPVIASQIFSDRSEGIKWGKATIRKFLAERATAKIQQ